jgi:putative phosphoribosyl transferase
VAFEVAKILWASLDVLLVQVGCRFSPELALEAIDEGAVRLVNESVLQQAELSEGKIAAVGSKQRPIAVITDDGIATGATAMAACAVVRAQGASRIVLAVPIGAGCPGAAATGPGRVPAGAR